MSSSSVVSVLIARTSDKLPLCSYTDVGFDSSGNVRQQQARILERMQPPIGASGSGSGYLSFDHKDLVFYVFSDAATNVSIIAAINKLLLSGPLVQGFACTLLDEVFAEFIATYPVEQIGSSTARPYGFIKFDTPLQKIIGRVATKAAKNGAGAGGSGPKAVGGTSSSGGGGGSSAHYDALKRELNDVHTVIKQNLEDILTRGERLQTMQGYSAQLREHSGKYYKKTVHLNRMRLLKLYGPPAVIGLLLLGWFFYFYL